MLMCLWQARSIVALDGASFSLCVCSSKWEATIEKCQCEQMHQWGDSTGEGHACGRWVGTSNQRTSVFMDVATGRGDVPSWNLCECVCVCMAGTSEGGCLDICSRQRAPERGT